MMSSSNTDRIRIRSDAGRAQETLVAVNGIGKRYPGASGGLAVRDVSFTIHEGEFVSVVGPSGCGKTTLLKMICGLLPSSSGEVLLHGKLVSGPPTEMVLVFQDYSRSLFPWLTVAENVESPLKANAKMRATVSASERTTRVAEALDAVGLSEFPDRHPWQLSGGMQQRLALARALAFRPEVLLLDEPFASVDALVREGLEDLILELQRQFGVTILLVTHDIDQAVYLSDRIVVLGNPPSVVVREVDVDLPAPRSQTETRSLQQFLDIRKCIHADIMGTA